MRWYGPIGNNPIQETMIRREREKKKEFVVYEARKEKSDFLSI